MSLKKFHIFFILICGLLSLFLLAWGIWDFRMSREVSSLVLSIVGVVGAAVLPFYLRWFLKKFNRLNPVFILIFSIVLFQFSSPLWACSVCFNDPQDPIVQSAFLGAGFLFALIVGVLTSIFFIGRSWVKRAKAMDQSF